MSRFQEEMAKRIGTKIADMAPSKLADLAELAGFSFKTRKFWQVKVIDPNSPWLASSNIPGKDVDIPEKPKYEPKPWKEASSLIIAAKVSAETGLGSKSENKSFQNVLPVDECDFRLLMAKRSAKSSYMANAYVFPGGYVELADFSTKWWAVFEAAGMSRDELYNFGADIRGPKPPIFTEPGVLMKEDNLNANILPAEVALRITAIRETFEETGVLLLNKAPNMRDERTVSLMTGASKADLDAWKKKIHENPVCFAELCLEAGLCPDIWALHEWWNWLTPEAIGHKRFDTIFYVCCLDFLPQNATHDDQEMTKVEWFSPLEMLEEHQQKRAVLAPPQVYELSRLSTFRSFDQLRNHARSREKQGVERWCANITGLKDGALLALPGDDFYEAGPEVNSKYLPTIQEVRLKSKYLNRIELRAPTMTAVCNIKLPYGHESPVSYPAINHGLQANL